MNAKAQRPHNQTEIFGMNSVTQKPTALCPVAIAVMLLSSVAWAQQPARDTTSADAPAAKTLFETDGQATIGPRNFTSFLDKLISPVDKVVITASGNNLAADGISGTAVTVELRDKTGARLLSATEVSIEVDNGARILLPSSRTSESGADRGDVDRIQPGVQTTISNGVLQFQLIAPFKPETVNIRVTARGVTERISVRYVPELREMIAVGLIEGRLRTDKFDPKAIEPARENDGFDEELRGFTKEFNGGKSEFGARAALYLKGKIKGEYLLTLNYDSDKETRQRLFNDIDPNAFYPIYGDSSIRGVDAQSSQKLYLRIDKNRSYVLFGDFITQDVNPARSLSQYQRSLPGLSGRYEEGKVTANAFVARESARQIVDEFAGRGVSGPYTVTNPNGIAGSERIEILVRRRLRETEIVKVTALTRGTDYEFEPFAGRILFRAPVPSVDDQLNPVSIRVTYEVDQGGSKHTIAGADLRLQLTPNLSVGAAIARDQNPAAPFDVAGLNLQLRLSKSTEVLAEVARSSSVVNTSPLAGGGSFNAFNTNNSANFAGQTGEVSGAAARVEIRHASEDLRARAYVARADNEFNNASSGITGGKTDAGASVNWRATERVTVTGELQKNDDRISGAESLSGALGIDLKLSNTITVGAGVRRVEQNNVSLAQTSVGTCSTSVVPTNLGGAQSGYNNGFGINATGNQLIDPATGLPVVCNTANNPVAPGTPTSLERSQGFVRVGWKPSDAWVLDAELSRVSGTDATSLLKVGARWQATQRLGLNAELQRGFGGTDESTYRLGADWAVAEKTRIYGRYERSQQYGGIYGLGVGPTNSGFALGIDTQYMQDGSLYSEYRLRDSASGRDLQRAIGLRNGWQLAEGLRLITNAERLAATNGNATALGAGLEYTANPLWKASGRFEWRQDAANTNYLATLGAARKLDRNWTFVARDYFNLVDPRDGVTSENRQNRLQLGFAFRPVDNNVFDALGLYENKTEDNMAAGIDRNVNIVSVRANYHPSRPWWISGRFAAKQVNELLNGQVRDSYTAQLFGGRVMYDITNRWSVGGLFTVLQGKGGTRQYAYGLEAGYVVYDNLWVTLGYNWRGFNDADLTGTEYTNRGWVLGVRYKFDEDLFKRNDSGVNKTLTPGATPTTPQPKP